MKSCNTDSCQNGWLILHAEVSFLHVERKAGSQFRLYNYRDASNESR
jgi:hypothetical protein